MIRYLAAAVFAVSVAGWAVPGIAADPTREQCTCDAVSDSVLNNGASVRNATVCWANVNEKRQWCDITVKAIEGDGRQQSVINAFVQIKDDPADVTAFLQDFAQSSFQADGDPSTMEFINKARAELPAILKNYDQLTTMCIENFLQHRESGGSFKDIDDGQFTCHIGESTGWLRMTFQIDDGRFVLMVAPHG